MAKDRIFAKKVAVLGIFTALALITFMIENLFPPLFLPGAKMGLSNIFSLAALIMFGPLEAFLVVIARTLLGAFIVGNVGALMYSFTGGMVSMAISCLLIYVIYPKISIMAVSICGAIAHNFTQNFVFAMANNSTVMLSYLPYFCLIGILSGLIVGMAIMLIFKKLPLSLFLKAVGKK